MGISRTQIGTYQMLWDCSCGTAALLGVDHRYCPNCGRPQDPQRRYFPDQADAVAAPEWLASFGPDHYCPYCDTANSSKATFCAGCGGPMDGSKDVELRDTVIGDGGETVQDAIAEARREAQEKREARRGTHRADVSLSEEWVRGRRQKRAQRLGALSPGPTSKREARTSKSPSKHSFHQRWDQVKRPVGIIGALVGVGALIWAIFFWEKTVHVAVESRTWERSQGVEQYTQLRGSEWCTRAPADRYNNLSYRKQHGTRTVVDCRSCDCHMERVKTGQRCRDTNCHNVRRDNGNGSFSVDRVCNQVCDPVYENRRVCHDRTHQEPVYEQWCEFNYDRWRETRRPSTSGTSSTEPVWPDLHLQECAGVRLGCERPGSRRHHYTVNLRDLKDPQKYQCEFSHQPTWEKYEEGSFWETTVKLFGGRFQCDELRPFQLEI